MQIQDLLDRYQTGERNFAHVDLSGANLSGFNLRDVDFTGVNLTGANLNWAFLSRAQLTGACLRRATLRSATLTSANLNQAILSGANLSKADLRLAQLQGADLNWAVLQEADLSGADLQGAKLDRGDLERAKLGSACLAKTELMEANLRRALLTNANLNQANLREAHLEEANLREATLIQATLIEANLSGVYLRSANLSEADLHRVILTGADLSEANLSQADLSRANLVGAYLLKTSFFKAHLLRADLQDAYLLRADLNEANLRGADLRRADLSGAYLSDAILSEANLGNAYLLETHLIRSNLDGANLTGCCIANWHIEDLDFSAVNCRHVFTQFNYSTKSPTSRYPIGRDFEPGEFSEQAGVDSAAIQVYFTETPNWEALVFTLAQVEQEALDLQLTIKAFEPTEDNFLLKLSADRLVNARLVSRRILQLYPTMLQRLRVHRSEILRHLEIAPRSPHLNDTFKAPPAPPLKNRRDRLYQEVVRQIQHILLSQAPEHFVQSVQNLMDYLDREGFSTEEIQKRLIGQAIVQRAKRDSGFRDYLLRWEANSTESARLSTVGQAVRLAIALLWTQSSQVPK